MSGIARHHAEWMSLVETSGPFLMLPALDRALPQGLPKTEAGKVARLRAAYEEWAEAQEERQKDADALHATWIRLVLEELLEFDEQTLRIGDRRPSGFEISVAEHHETIRPDIVIVEPLGRANAGAPRFLVSTWPFSQKLESAPADARWAASPLERVTHLCRSTGIRLALVTNGDRWTLVDAPVGQTAGYASWYSNLWLQEPLTLAAFETLVGVRRFFASAETDTLEALLDESVAYQHEVTDQLGLQVRRAVEVLVQALDRADLDRNRELLRDVPPARLYDAALTVMMRLVFLFCAEERRLLLLGDETYDANYAVSTLRALLREEADRVGVEVLERRQDAWARLLATFRAVHGGIEHEALRLPALGGSLFDPDRFPFLEGRAAGTAWRDAPATPLPIDNRTALHLLEALQLLRMRGDGGRAEARKLSYRALDIEQIGHVYEGLLDHVAVRVDADMLGLVGSKDNEPEISVDQLERERREGKDELVEFLKEHTGRSISALRNDLDATLDEDAQQRLFVACGNDKALLKRIAPYHALLRKDLWGYPQIYRAGSFMVTGGPERRQTGTHYTPKSLTEQIVTQTLEPLTFVGPADGKPRDAWKLRSAAELLDLKICDMAMGSGAFLVQVCRWLAERLVEAWEEAERRGAAISAEGEVLKKPGGDFLPPDREERLSLARRMIAERCIYGVDINPMAVELAKLSLWLVTLSKGRPFGFLDHNLRRGDSMLGISRLEQLTELSMTPIEHAQGRLFGRNVRQAVEEALAIRIRLRGMPIRDIRDVEAMASLDAAAREKVTTSERIADAFIGLVFVTENAQDLERWVATIGSDADRSVQGNATALRLLERLADDSLREGFLHERKALPFHWPLQFPEVFLREQPGFDAFVGNPPFLGNRLWKGTQGPSLQRIVQLVLGVAPGKIDLSVAFHRRAAELLRVNGGYGLLATNNIAEGSAVAVGLEQIAKQGHFYFTRKGLPWPGSASIVVAIVCFAKGRWSGQRLCDGVACERIGPRLEPEVAGGWEPKPLADALFAFAGVDNSKGLAFVVTVDHPWFDRLRSERESLLRPYVTGNDITSTALRRVERWALDIGDLRLEEIAKRWPLAHGFLLKEVKPTRTPQELKSYKGLIDRWWQFWNHRADQMRRLREQQRFVAFAKAAKYAICVIAPTDWLYTNQVVLVEAAREDVHAICLSSMFQMWLRNYSLRSLGGDNNTMRLSISEALATFPLPEKPVAEVGIGAARAFQSVLVSWSGAHDGGMTDAMNAVHSRDVTDDGTLELRRLMGEIDREVALAYGWTTNDLAHDFHDELDGEGVILVRHGLSPLARNRVVAALIALNRDRYEEEQSAALAAKHKSSKGRAKAAPADQGALALVDAPVPMTYETKAAAPAKKASTRRTGR